MKGVYIFVFNLLCVSVQGYFWDLVENSNDYHIDTVWHTSTDEGTQAVCRIKEPQAVGRDHAGLDTCFYPYFDDEYTMDMPFEVLVRDRMKEIMVWEYNYNSADIRERGVHVCSNCDPEPEMYVCAVSHWGPGKLVVWGDDDLCCYVSWDWEEHEFYDDYVVLMAEPAYEYSLTEVNYYLDELDVLEDTPVHMAEATLVNNDDSDHIIIHTLVYTKSSTNEWENGYGFTQGTAMSVSAGIPELLASGWEISAEETYEYSYGESHTESIEVSLQVQVNVPAEHSCDVRITARQMLADVPYDASATVRFPDGTTTTEYISGVYEGLSVSQDRAEIDKCIPLT